MIASQSLNTIKFIFSRSIPNYTVRLDVMLLFKNSIVMVTFLLLQIICSTAYASSPTDMPTIIDDELEAEIVYQGIKFPTSMAFLGPDDIIVLEKDEGSVRRIVNGSMMEEPLLDAAVSSKGERGMLGVAVDKDNASSYIFVYYTESSTKEDSLHEEPLGNRLYRYKFEDNKLSDGKLLLEIPADSSAGTGYHVGGKMLIGPDGNIYLMVGDMDRYMTKSQNIDDKKSSPTSAIFRITQEGEAAPLNPLGESDPIDKFFAYGIRNSFGIDFDPVTGNLWDTENGRALYDEINRIEPGFNSGWRKIQGFSDLQDDFDPDRLVDYDGRGKYSDPEFVWNLTVAPTALTFLDSDKYGEGYKNDLFVGDIKFGNLYRFELNDDRTELKLSGKLKDQIANDQEEQELSVFGKGFGGIVDMEIGPDGLLYILSISKFSGLSSPLDYDHSEGTIYRIMPRSDYGLND
jgi:aldose sugar dehydrogenase